jgi:hypothetical protein
MILAEAHLGCCVNGQWWKVVAHCTAVTRSWPHNWLPKAETLVMLNAVYSVYLNNLNTDKTISQNIKWNCSSKKYNNTGPHTKSK